MVAVQMVQNGYSNGSEFVAMVSNDYSFELWTMIPNNSPDCLNDLLVMVHPG